jgi:spoIIIJ-associated protein
MSDQRGSRGKKFHGQGRGRPQKNQQQAEARLDHDGAVGQLKEFLAMAVPATGLAIEWDVATPQGADSTESEIVVTFRGADEELLLDHNAELLLALEHIAHRWLKLDPRLHDRVRLDCGDYRANRLDELKLSAKVAAQRVRETGQPHRFNPMSSRERRVIHLELTGAPGVRTMSEGSGDRRQLVIYPANSQSYKK